MREFVELAFGAVGKTVEWDGEGVDEVGFDRKSGNRIIEIDPRHFRPTEVDILLGNPQKARDKLNWRHSVSFEDLVSEMVESDLRTFMREEGRNDYG
jgi:GDPmannose 4,6-dehydratase